MDTTSTALLIAAAVVGLVDWWAVSGVSSLQRRVESVAKPVAMALLVGVAASAGSPHDGVRIALVIGAVLGLVGDVALLGNTETRFMAGLGAFAVGHLAYAIAAVQVDVSAWASVGVAFMVVLLAFRFATRILPGAKRIGGSVLAGAVVFYGAVITVMVVTAWGIFTTDSPAWLAGVGAVLFAVSDWVLGHQRFAGPLAVGRLGVMVPYHVGQALLILGIALA